MSTKRSEGVRPGSPVVTAELKEGPAAEHTYWIMSLRKGYLGEFIIDRPRQLGLKTMADLQPR